MSKREMIITIVASIIGSGIFNVLLTSYLYERQLEEERKNEYEADMYAVSKIGKKDVLYGLEYLYRMVDFPLSTKLELRSRINNVIKNG